MSEKKFKVGDVVISLFDNEWKGVVTRVDDDVIYILWPDGSCGFSRDGSLYEKTGAFLDIERHILSKLRSYK